MNTDELEQAKFRAERRVLEIQAKLHRWAAEDAHRRFDDLYNLVCDPAFLLVGWLRVRSNKGARTAGVDGETAHYIEDVRGLDGFLAELRTGVKDRTFQPLPARQRAIPKAGGKVRYLGIATIRDPGRWWPADEGVTLLDPATVRTIRYRYRGAAIPSPWPSTA